MVVMILETVPLRLRGELSRWLIEPHPGIFVGHVNAMVRDRLWEKCCQGAKEGGVWQLWSTNNEQKFQMRAYGNTKREIVDFDGVQLIRIPPTASAAETTTPKRWRKRTKSSTAGAQAS
jgi:CRISPR-associated protein Cas2